MCPVPLKIFLCHSSSDKSKVRDIYQRLLRDGFEPWLDEEDLIPGQEWQTEIPKTVRNSDIVIICLSNNSITKSGYIQREIKYALDVADEKTPGTIFLVPLKLEECKVPERLGNWQWVNYHEETGHEKLLKALQHRAGELGLLIDKVHVDEGCSPWSDISGSEVAVKFTPDSYPQKLAKARFYIDKGGKPWAEFEARVYKDEDSKPGCRLDSGSTRACGKIGGEWVEVNFSEQNIVIKEGSFFISMYWLMPPSSQGRNAQFLASQYTKDEMQGLTFFKWAHKGEWRVAKGRSCFVEVTFGTGTIQKGYKLKNQDGS